MGIVTQLFLKLIYLKNKQIGCDLKLNKLVLIFYLTCIGWGPFSFSASAISSGFATNQCDQTYGRFVSVGGEQLACQRCINSDRFQITQIQQLGKYSIDRTLSNIELYPVSFRNSGWDANNVERMLELANNYLLIQKCDVQLSARELVEVRVPVDFDVLEEPDQIEFEKNFGILPLVVLADDLLRKSRVPASTSKDEIRLTENEEEQTEQSYNFSQDTNGLGIIGMGYIYLSNNLLLEKQRTTCLPLLLIHELFHAMLGYETAKHERDIYNVFYTNCFAKVHTIENTRISRQDCKNLQSYAQSVAMGRKKVCKTNR